jgi:hypothetical protein
LRFQHGNIAVSGQRDNLQALRLLAHYVKGLPSNGTGTAKDREA